MTTTQIFLRPMVIPTNETLCSSAKTMTKHRSSLRRLESRSSTSKTRPARLQTPASVVDPQTRGFTFPLSETTMASFPHVVPFIVPSVSQWSDMLDTLAADCEALRTDWNLFHSSLQQSRSWTCFWRRVSCRGLVLRSHRSSAPFLSSHPEDEGD